MYHGTVSSQPSLGGTYTGIEPTGLLWSVVPEEKHRHKNPRLVKMDTSIPWKYKISMIEGADVTNEFDCNLILESDWSQRGNVLRG